jgi:large conductance mechanosensitive channel
MAQTWNASRGLAQPAVSLLQEFKAFVLKGNVVDLAIGIIIGAAFGKIVDSFVKHIVMPFISVLLPAQQSYLEWKLVVNGKPIPYGLFLGEVLNFLVVAAAVFIFLVKLLGWIMREKKEEAAAPPPPPQQEVLLAEIRDLLRERRA